MCANRSGCLLLVLGAVFAVQVNDIGGQTIQCACTTVECMLLNTKVCNTSQLCYSQFLETSDSINPMTRGCINSASTLLCENRKPETLESSWPVLHCCSEPMCNEGVIPPVPSWHPNTIEQERDPEDRTSESQINIFRAENEVENTDDETGTEDNKDESGWITDPLYIAIAIAGLCLVVLIVVLGLFFIQQKRMQYQAANIQEEEFYSEKTSHSGLHRMMHSKECAGDPYICEKFFNSV